jgi:hypothetical protein
VATLVVVMVLFFVVAMVAAYTSRNLIFEQKTSANQYRSTIAFEAADAGVDWALAMLNGGLIDDNCAPSTTLPGSSFQQRYLTIANNASTNPVPAPANGTIAPNRRGFGPAPTPPASDPLGNAAYWPACSLNGGVWGIPASCSCPSGTQLAPASNQQPAFRVWLARPQTIPPSPPTTRAGLFDLQVNGCTRTPAAAGTGQLDCLDQDFDSPPTGFVSNSLTGDAVATMRVVVALRPSMASMPAAAVTAQAGITVSPVSASVRLVNNDAASNGITAHAGGALPAPGSGLDVTGLPGTPPAATLVRNDQRLASLATQQAPGADPVADSRMFVSQFGMKPATYREQPGARLCPGAAAATCSAATLQQLLNENPQRVLWVDGNLTLEANLGSVTAPVLLVVNGGTLTVSQNVTVVGLVYVVGTPAGSPGPLQVTVAAPNSGLSTIQGALVAGGSLQFSHAGGVPAAGNGLQVVYDRGVLNLLRTTYGSWVRLPGGWRDFRD